MSSRPKLSNTGSPTKGPCGAAPKPRDKMSRLVKRPGAIVGNPATLVEVKTFNEAVWREKWDKRLK